MFSVFFVSVLENKVNKDVNISIPDFLKASPKFLNVGLTSLFDNVLLMIENTFTTYCLIHYFSIFKKNLFTLSYKESTK